MNVWNRTKRFSAEVVSESKVYRETGSRDRSLRYTEQVSVWSEQLNVEMEQDLLIAGASAVSDSELFIASGGFIDRRSWF